MDYDQADKQESRRKDHRRGGGKAATSRRRLEMSREIGMAVPTRLHYSLGKAEDSSGEHCLSYSYHGDHTTFRPYIIQKEAKYLTSLPASMTAFQPQTPSY